MTELIPHACPTLSLLLAWFLSFIPVLILCQNPRGPVSVQIPKKQATPGHHTEQPLLACWVFHTHTHCQELHVPTSRSSQQPTVISVPNSKYHSKESWPKSELVTYLHRWIEAHHWSESHTREKGCYLISLRTTPQPSNPASDQRQRKNNESRSINFIMFPSRSEGFP